MNPGQTTRVLFSALLSLFCGGAFAAAQSPAPLELDSCVFAGRGLEALPSCGDGKLDKEEDCDDGNQQAGDGCSATCAREVLYTADSDLDGISDEDERRLGTDPQRADSDGDGLCDGIELVPGACVGIEAATLWQDTDQDGLIDALDPDDDGDGVPTREELAWGCQASTADHDRDGLDDWQDPDSDNDGIADAQEPRGDKDGDGHTDRLDRYQQDGPLGDLDQDGLTNAQERRLGTHPLRSDTDQDGLPDAIEAPNGQPLDHDGDGRIDALDADSDNDGLSDAEEGVSDLNHNGLPDYRDSEARGPMSAAPAPQGGLADSQR